MSPQKIETFSFGGIAQLARAVALQAIGQGFESPYLHKTRVILLFVLLHKLEAGRQSMLKVVLKEAA